MMNRHIRNEVLKSYPLHHNQFAYQPGMSTETAVHTHRMQWNKSK